MDFQWIRVHVGYEDQLDKERERTASCTKTCLSFLTIRNECDRRLIIWRGRTKSMNPVWPKWTLKCIWKGLNININIESEEDYDCVTKAPILYFLRSWVGRGVRSDVQLSCTETRFQKCSQSGKNGSKHPMLSISMAYNMISCKKVERNTQKIKIADFTM